MFKLKKNLIKSFISPFIVAGILLAICSSFRVEAAQKTPGTVDVYWNGSFTEVQMQFNDSTRTEMWALYTEKLLQLFPSLEADYDAWLSRGMNTATYQERFEKLQYLKPQVPQEYREEIEGMASRLSGGDDTTRGDGKLSIDEVYYVSLYVDIMMARGCSAIAVFGSASVTGTNMLARLVDWYPRKDNAVFTINNGDKSMVNIGRRLSIMAGTAFNDNGVFAAILDGGHSPLVDFKTKPYRSVTVDIRYALENYSTLEAVAKFLSEQEYTFCHEIFLADTKTGGVLENNLLVGGVRSLRGASSTLAEGVPWEFDDAVVAVNTFYLKGNYRGQGIDPRWTSFRKELADKLRKSENGEVDKITFNELKAIATFYDKRRQDAYPGSTFGDIYNSSTQYIVLFEPQTFHLEVFFRNGSLKPVRHPTFTKVPVSFHHPKKEIRDF
jgi:hypothetical protein